MDMFTNLDKGVETMRAKRSLATYTASHFCVDFACFYLLFSWLSRGTPGQTAAVGFLLYNALAFGLQPIIGWACDRRPSVAVAPLGAVLILLALAVRGLPWIAIVAIALGNACFHVGGGIDSLNKADGKAARSGIFVSSGALGVSLGTLYGRAALATVWLPFGLIALSLVAMIAFCREEAGKPQPVQPFHFANPSRAFALVIGMMFVSIAIRAFAGSIVPIGWRTTAFLAVVPGLSACVGKASGGLLADRFGPRTVGVASLALSIPCLALAPQIPWICALGLVLFNMSMSITLCTIASELPGYAGLSFGLTTLALLVGNVPTFFLPKPTPLAAALAIAIASGVSCLFLFASVTNQTHSKGRVKHAPADARIARRLT